MSATHLVDVLMALSLRCLWLVRGEGLMDAYVPHTDLTEDCCVRIFNALTPEQQEAWLRVGVMLLASGVDDMSIGVDG
jgi:hypothetical protein